MDPFVYLLLSLLLIGFGFFVFRVAVRRDYQKKGELSSFATFLEFLIFAAHANLSYAFLPAPYPEIPPIPENSIWATLGLWVMGIGIFLTLWAMSGLGFKKAFGQDPGTLNRIGFYQYTRNPQILFYGLAIAGMAITWASLNSLVWVLLYAIIAQMMVATEEEHLSNVFKGDYDHYRREVPRYLPNPWRKRS